MEENGGWSPSFQGFVMLPGHDDETDIGDGRVVGIL